MTCSVVSEVINIQKDCQNIEKSLEEVCTGEIIRWAIVGVEEDFFKVSFSYKK